MERLMPQIVYFSSHISIPALSSPSTPRLPALAVVSVDPEGFLHITTVPLALLLSQG